ncbi:MAG TPA: P-type DNA transfer ATPase VirB11 [Sphingobium sp.]
MESVAYYLKTFLAPLSGLLDQADVTDIYVNRPGEVWAERAGGTIDCIKHAELSTAMLEQLARQIAAMSHQGISREHPLLSASLPHGERVQIIAPPATRRNYAIAIRKQVTANFGLAELGRAGVFDRQPLREKQERTDTALGKLLRAGQWEELLRLAVHSRKTILVSGGTATGKTTLLNALIQEIPTKERLIYIEDTPELDLVHSNAIGLIAARSALGEATVSAESLVAASMRMRPDRVIVGEVRGSEAFSFLRAINSGHPGSMTSIHADSPEGAIDQLALLLLQSGTQLRRDDIHHYVARTIDVYVQLSRLSGKRFVSDIALRSPAGTLVRV